MVRLIVTGLIVIGILGDVAVGGRRKTDKVVVEDKPKVNYEFIDKIHSLSSDIAKETVIHDNQVVWSPYSVVNILPIIDPTLSLKDSFNSSLSYLNSIEGLSLKRVSVVISNRSVNASDYDTKLLPFPSESSSIEQVVRDVYKKEVGVEAPSNLVAKDFVENSTEVYLTSLGVSANWEVPFHYGHTRTNRFYINSTHAIKTRYLVNVGYYKYAELEDLDARIVAIPLKDAPTAFFVVVLPNHHDGLEHVSNELGKRNVSDLFDEMKTKRVYLRLPKIDVDNHLVFTKGDAKIVQSGSLHLGYSGIETIYSKQPQQRIKYKQLKKRGGINFRVENPFIFMIYETTQGGILNYGEVMIPSERPVKATFKYQQNYLSQNGKILSEAVDKLGDDLYASIRKRTEGSFVFSPLSLTNLLGSVLSGVETETQTEILGKLNFPVMWQDALQELNREGKINSSSSRVNVIVNGEAKESFRQTVTKFGTNVVTRQARDFTTNYTVKSILGASDYELNPQLNAETKTIEGRFYRNEIDTENTTFLEFFTPDFKYLYVPFWDAKIVSIPLNDGQNQSLLLVVPGERSGLSAVEQGIRDYPVSKLLCQGHVRRTAVRLRLPLLALEHIVDFSEDLKELGLSQFETADFSGIVENGRLDRLVQRTVLRLRQDNSVPATAAETELDDTVKTAQETAPALNVTSTTESATTVLPEATTAKLSRKSRSKNSSKRRPSQGHGKGSGNNRNYRSKLVKVDRPFVFYVQDARIGTVLVGRYVGSDVVYPTPLGEPQQQPETPAQ